MDRDTRTRLSAVAAGQGGRLGRAQLIAAGLDRDGIWSSLRCGHLLRERPGVYLLGPAVAGRLGEYHAAVLAGGPGTYLASRAAAALWGIGWHDAPPELVVRVPRRGPKGLPTHRTRRLAAADVTRRHGLPVTTLARTVVDLAEDEDHDDLLLAADEARHRHGLTARTIARAAARLPGRRGRPRLDRVIADLEDGVRSPLERRIRDGLRDAGLPAPRRNVEVAGVTVDAAWPEAKLALEIDSFTHHRDREAFERDRARDAHLAARGWTTLRVTDRGWREHPGRTLAAVRARLSA